jgi:enoyl-CoA hydratase/carnithine racemase
MTTPDSPFVIRSDEENGVTTLTLNRAASFNALSEGMLSALANRT